MTETHSLALKRLSLAAALAAAAAMLLPAAGQRTFSSPQEAAQALIDAAGKNDTEALLKLFGPEGRTIVVSGDAAEDKNGREEFAHLAHEGMHIDQPNPARAIIEAGPDNWPFPVPLVRKNGQWIFDSAQGKIEVLARRVGRNELNAIDVCRGYVEAQMEYAARDRDADGILEYAQTIVSRAGTAGWVVLGGRIGDAGPEIVRRRRRRDAGRAGAKSRSRITATSSTS